VKKQQNTELDFIIDKLTNSVENVQSGDSFPTEISLLTKEELKMVTKRNGWRFNWANEFKAPERDIYKLTIANNPKIIQGIISLEVKADHVYMHLIESAPFNIGKCKTYFGCRETWLHLRANFRSNVVAKAMFRLLPKLNLLTIILKAWVQFISADI